MSADTSEAGPTPSPGLSVSPIARQALGYTVATALASVLSLVATAIVARNVSTDAFGAFSFAVALLGFVALFFEFGVYAATARIAATSSADRPRVVAAALLLYVPIGIAFSVGMLLAIPIADRWFSADLGTAMLLAAVLGAGYPFAFVGLQLAQGIDRLHIASVGGLAFPGLFLGLLAAVAVVGTVDAGSALVVRSVALLGAGAVVAVWLRPVLTRVRETVAEILRQTREYGLDIYLGRILSIGTYNMDVLLVGVWSTAEDVGYYALAVSIAAAAGLPVIALSTALYARLAGESRIEPRWIGFSIVVGGVLAIVAYALAGPFVDVVFSERYRDVLPLLVPLLVAQAVRGTTSLFNVFLSAHGRGVELRNAGLVLTASNLVLNFALIPPYGATGAAWATLGALVANLAAHVVFYTRSQRRMPR